MKGHKVSICTLFADIQVEWKVDCKKCITDPVTRVRAWAELEHHIAENLFKKIPEKYDPSAECEYLGECLDGILSKRQCCGGKIKYLPKYECVKYNKAVTEKDCLECRESSKQDV